MNPLEGLAQYLERLEKRLRLFTWTRGAAVVLGAALILTIAIVAALILFAFSPSGLIAGRFLLFVGVGAAIAAGLVIPLMRMNRRRAAGEIEQRHPGFDQRLLTFTERSSANASDPFLPLLAEDALEIARDAEPTRVIDNGRIMRFAGIGAAAASVLVYLVFWGPGVFGYGTSLLWGSYSKDQPIKPFYSISVQPGSKTIRRKSDVPISATLSGFTSSHASLRVQYASAPKWEEAPMSPASGAPGFGFLLPGVPEDVQYYVEAGGIKSATFKLHTVDLPAVKNIRVTYNYPSWTGMASTTEDPGGDLRAVQGTVAKVEIETDKPLSDSQIVFEDGKPINLDATKNNRTTANVPIEKDGMYHIAVMDHGEPVRLTDDYFIEARKVSPPTVHITKPGRDAKVSPIEEVGIAVGAEDEFPLQELDLHYSVNGGAEKTISLLKQKGAKQVDGSTMLSMEDFKLVPGDIVSMYATARDGKNSSQTDIAFIQAVPFEFEYSQSQEAGSGGGGMGSQDEQISEREKEIIAATFNQIKGGAKAQAAAAENGKYLSSVQAKLRDQAQSLADRTKARQLDGSGAAFQQFVKEMEQAVAFMTPASDKLKALGFQDALTPEQQALQHVLRAESTFRQIQVQISRGGGGGGGGGGGAGRDLANLFDLELDKDKNQYETNASSSAEQKQQQIDEALKKLEELARRQQELAQQQQMNNAQQLAQQRWQQEMLRREAEELKRQMEQLQRDQSQQGQQGQQGQQAANGSQSGQQGQQSAQGGQPSRGQQGGLGRQQSQQLDQAIRDLEQATRDMSNAASARQPGQQNPQNNAQAQAQAQQAAERLKQADQMLQAMRHQQTGSEMGDIAEKAEQLANRQQDFEQRLRRNFGAGQNSRFMGEQMADEKQRMRDEYTQLQKNMQQTARDVSGTQPQISKELRDAMGKSQQAEIGTKMEFTEEALRQGMGQYAIMREAPVTQALNELKDQLKKLAAESVSQQASNGDDKSQIATQQALDQAERIRREMEQLARSETQRGRNGNQPGKNQNGQQQGQGNQPGQGQGQQQAGNGSQGQQGGGQQGGQQGQQGGMGPRGGYGPDGGGYGVNNGPWDGRNGTWTDQPFGAYNFGDSQTGPDYPTQASAEAAYNDMMRDIGRLRNQLTDNKDLDREFQDLMRRAQQLDPRHWNNDPQLGAVIGAQVMSEIDEVELVLRRKLAAGDNSVRSTSPRDIPPGYADAVAEYNKRLSKQ